MLTFQPLPRPQFLRRCRDRFTYLGIAVALGSLTLAAQNAVPALPSTPYNYTIIQYPAHFALPGAPPGTGSVVLIDDTPATNPNTDAGTTLGRVLFYDKNLSKTQTVACGSCHVQSHGFSDPNRFSTGFAGGKGTRHAPGLSNVRFNPAGHAFWDERAGSLEIQALLPIQDAVEMGLTLTELVQRVGSLSYYPALFQAAFGDTSVTSDRIAKAIAQFDRSIISYQSKYDVGRAQVTDPGIPFPNFTTQENRGKQLFLTPPPQGGANCIACHRGEAFLNDQGPINNGLNASSTADPGASAISGNAAQLGAFRFPSLRDIAMRAPYMHDGRFATLEDVVDFYDHGVQNNPNLDQRLRGPGGTPLRLNLNQSDKAALVAFLGTLTDTQLLSDPRFSDPFLALLSKSAASLVAGQASPDSIVAGTGQNLASTTLSGPLPLLTALGGVQVLVKDSSGAERAAALYYVSPTQINYVVPHDAALGQAAVTVVLNGNIVSQGPLLITGLSPAIFTANGDGAGVPAAYAVSVDSAGQQVYSPTYRTSTQGYLPASINAAKGDVILELYGTGLRNGIGQITATIGGIPATVVYAGAHSIYAGMDQINVRVPAACSGYGTQQLVLKVSGSSSNPVDLSF
ncbi:MAG: cytochrome c peroxidase [Acidobacteriota bacterium]